MCRAAAGLSWTGAEELVCAGKDGGHEWNGRKMVVSVWAGSAGEAVGRWVAEGGCMSGEEQQGLSRSEAVGQKIRKVMWA